MSGCPLVSPSEKKVLMRQEAESKLLAQANSMEPEVQLVKLRSGKGEGYDRCKASYSSLD